MFDMPQNEPKQNSLNSLYTNALQKTMSISVLSLSLNKLQGWLGSLALVR